MKPDKEIIEILTRKYEDSLKLTEYYKDLLMTAKGESKPQSAEQISDYDMEKVLGVMTEQKKERVNQVEQFAIQLLEGVNRPHTPDELYEHYLRISKKEMTRQNYASRLAEVARHKKSIELVLLQNDKKSVKYWFLTKWLENADSYAEMKDKVGLIENNKP